MARRELEAARRAARLGRSISAWQKQRQWQRALWEYQRQGAHGGSATPLCNAALGAAAAGSAWASALAIFHAAEIGARDVSTYTAAMTAMAKAKRWPEGAEILGSMERASLNLDLPAKLLAIRLHGALGRHEAALALAAAPGTPVEVYNACMSAMCTLPCSTTREAEAARQMVKDLLMEMRQRVTFTRRSFGAAVSAFGKCGAWQEALGLLSEMSQKELALDAQAVTGALGACGRARKWRQALQLLAEAEATGLADLGCRNTCLSAVARAGLWRFALHLLASLNSEASAVSWNASITACAEAAEWLRALQLLELMRDADTAPQADAVSFNAALAACRNGSRWAEALDLLAAMPGAQLRPDASSLSTALSALQRAGKPQLGLLLPREGKAAYNAALRSAADAGLWAEAVQLLEEMQQRGVPFTRLACKAALRACAAAPHAAAGAAAAAALQMFRAWLPEEELSQLAAGLEHQLLGARRFPESAAHAGPHPQHLPRLPLPAEEVDLAPLRAAALGAAASGGALRLLGSRAEGLATQDSDVDATLILPEELRGSFEEQRDLQRQVLRKVRNLVQGLDGWEVQELVLEAKRPILRLILPCGARCDVSVEHRLGCRKSAWIQQLRLQHPGLGAALVLLKTWAQRRQVYGQSVGFPSGLGFNCLGLFAVQQSLPQVGLVEVPDFAPEAKAWHQEDLSAVPSLVTRIFRFYAEDFDWHSELVSIRLARRSAKAARGDVRVLAIEDPVETYLDLARPYMNQARSELLRREMCAAAASLGSGSWEGFQ